MDAGLEALPDDIDALKAALIAAHAEAAVVRAERSDEQALNQHTPVALVRAFP
jgi:hypothetical protein